MKDSKHIRRFNESDENLNSELSKDTSSSISDVSASEINELFGVDGSVNVKIEGHGPIREVVLDILRKSLKGLNGDVNLYFGDEKVHL
jgi:hypothetical protein